MVPTMSRFVMWWRHQLPEAVFNSLMLYNNVSILYVLSGEFHLKFQI